MPSTYRGVLIEESVHDPHRILSVATVVSRRTHTLEQEAFRGTLTFVNIEVSAEALWPALNATAEELKDSGGWYFHLVGDGRLYVVFPRAILLAREAHAQEEIGNIIDFGLRWKIHPDQLDLRKLFSNPYV